MLRNYLILPIEIVPSKVATLCVAGLLSTAAIFADAAPAQAQNWRGYGAGLAAGIIGGAIIGGALSQQHGNYRGPYIEGAPRRATTRKHRRNDEDETTTPASAPATVGSKETKEPEGMSLARGVYSTSSSDQGGAGSKTSSDEGVGLVRDKAR